MLLSGKNAVIYGGGGSIGGRVALAFAREGAKVHLCGHNLAPVNSIAEKIRTQGGVASAFAVDATDADAVGAHLDHVEKEHGRIDISFNLMAFGTIRARL